MLTTLIFLHETDFLTISVTIDIVVTNRVVALTIDLTLIDVHFEGERVTLAVLVILTLISVIALEGSILVFISDSFFLNNFITSFTFNILLGAT